MTEAKHIPLEPCPFCGSEAEIERRGGRRQSTIYRCTSFGCTLETGEEWDYGRHWNTRTPTSLHVELVAALFNLVEAVESAVDLDNHVRSFGTRVAAAHNALQKARQK